MRAVVFLATDDWLEVGLNTRVTATVAGQERAAKVERVARTADLTSGRGGVTVSIANAARDWRAGMFARLRFELAPMERVVIASSAMIITDQGAF